MDCKKYSRQYSNYSKMYYFFSSWAKNRYLMLTDLILPLPNSSAWQQPQPVQCQAAVGASKITAVVTVPVIQYCQEIQKWEIIWHSFSPIQWLYSLNNIKLVSCKSLQTSNEHSGCTLVFSTMPVTPHSISTVSFQRLNLQLKNV